MTDNALVQTRIDPEIKRRAAQVLDGMGLSISDAVRILLTRTAREGVLPLELMAGGPAYDDWFRAKVMEALADTRPDSDAATVEAHFAARRAKALKAGRR